MRNNEQLSKDAFRINIKAFFKKNICSNKSVHL